MQVARVARAAGHIAPCNREREGEGRRVPVSRVHGNERPRRRLCSVRAPGVPRVLGRLACAQHAQMPQMQSADRARRPAGTVSRRAPALLALLRRAPASSSRELGGLGSGGPGVAVSKQTECNTHSVYNGIHAPGA